MKKLFVFCLLIIIGFGFVNQEPALSSIYGNIEPPEAAKMVWAVSGKDSLSVAPETGKFSIAVTPGTWTIHIEAVSPYKDIILENIVVSEGRSTNAGVIRMSKR
jgi:hypothetical protein